MTNKTPHTLISTLASCLLAVAGCASDLEPEDNGDPGTATEGVTTTGGDVRMTVVNASDHDAWLYFDLDSVERVDADDGGWDLAFQRFKIMSNGGVSGDGAVAAAALDAQDFDALSVAPEGDYVQDAEDSDGDEDDEPDHALSGWYKYDPSDHSLSPKAVVYVIRGTEGDFFKLQMLDYYDAAGTAGFPSFRWAAVDPPDGDIAVADADAADPVGEQRDDAARQAEPGTPGCYDMSTHVCDCDGDEAACDDVGGTWTDQCVCDVADPGDDEGDAGEAEEGSEAPGCYDMSTHMCDCEGDEAACEDVGGTWTEQCGC